LTQSIGFYSALFAADPAVTKPDYAKWMLDDPMSSRPCLDVGFNRRPMAKSA
jgi:hypothetical protein